MVNSNLKANDFRVECYGTFDCTYCGLILLVLTEINRLEPFDCQPASVRDEISGKENKLLFIAIISCCSKNRKSLE